MNKKINIEIHNAVKKLKHNVQFVNNFKNSLKAVS